MHRHIESIAANRNRTEGAGGKDETGFTVHDFGWLKIQNRVFGAEENRGVRAIDKAGLVLGENPVRFLPFRRHQRRGERFRTVPPDFGDAVIHPGNPPRLPGGGVEQGILNRVALHVALHPERRRVLFGERAVLVEPVILEFLKRQRWMATHAVDTLPHARWVN